MVGNQLDQFRIECCRKDCPELFFREAQVRVWRYQGVLTEQELVVAIGHVLKLVAVHAAPDRPEMCVQDAAWFQNSIGFAEHALYIDELKRVAGEDTVDGSFRNRLQSFKQKTDEGKLHDG